MLNTLMGCQKLVHLEDGRQQEKNVEQSVELCIRLFTDGPRRSAEQVDPVVRERVRAMTTENWQKPGALEAPESQPLEPPAVGRLADITCPLLIIVGDQDVPESREIAAFSISSPSLA
jgi:3-oxoadipate enol-lactonase